MSDCKETLCSCCCHLEVCKNKERYLGAVEAIDSLVIYHDNECQLLLSDINWLEAKLKCKFFYPKNSTFLKGE